MGHARILYSGGGSTPIPVDRALFAARDGDVVVVPGAFDASGLRDAVEALDFSAIELVVSPAAAAAGHAPAASNISTNCAARRRSPGSSIVSINRVHRLQFPSRALLSD